MHDHKEIHMPTIVDSCRYEEWCWHDTHEGFLDFESRIYIRTILIKSVLEFR